MYAVSKVPYRDSAVVLI